MDSKKVSKKKVSSGESNNLFRALEIAWTMGYVIVIPLLVAVWGGRWLDERTGRSPLFLLVGMLLASIFSSIGLVKKFKQYLAKIN